MTDPTLSLADLAANPDHYILIDVRDEAEFLKRHIPGALNMPLSRLEAEVARIPRDKLPVAVCGKGGGRSAEATARLRVAGLPGALWLEGGTVGWHLANQRT